MSFIATSSAEALQVKKLRPEEASDSYIIWASYIYVDHIDFSKKMNVIVDTAVEFPSEIIPGNL